MTNGHREAQELFLSIGKALGYKTSRTFSAEFPTDGVWWTQASFAGEENLPVAALEVAASESPKNWRGSINTLESVSPAIGVLVLQDEVIRRRLVKDGWVQEQIELEITRQFDAMERAAKLSKTRIRVLTASQLRYEYRMTNSVAA